MKKFLLAALILLIAGYVVTTPIITSMQMKFAAEANDGEALSTHIDFPTLRQNMKDQLNANLAKQMTQAGNDNPFAALGAAIAPMIVEQMVNAYITPAAVSAMMRGEQAQQARPEDGSATSEQHDVFENAEIAYKNLNEFVITVPNEQGDTVDFVLTRNGLDWKLTNILIPVT